MKHIKLFENFRLDESVPQDGFHNKFFKDPEPGLTNFTEIAVCTKPIDVDNLLYSTKGDPGNRNNPTVESIDVPSFKYKSYYAKTPTDIDKLHIYKIHYQGKRYADSEFPNQFFLNSLTNRGGAYWRAKYDMDKKSIFSPYPFSKNYDMPQEVYDYLNSYKGETKENLLGISDIKHPISFCWKLNIHKSATLYFDENENVVEIENTLNDIKWYPETKKEAYSDNDNNGTDISIDISNWMGKKITESDVKKFFTDEYPWMSIKFEER